MANLTDGYERELNDGLTGVTPLTTPTTVYLALFTADPGDAGSVVSEVVGGSYNRVSLAGKFSSATGTDGNTANTAVVTFPTATANQGTITYLGFMKSGIPTTDDMMVWSVLASPITINTDGIFEIAIGDLDITVA